MLPLIFPDVPVFVWGQKHVARLVAQRSACWDTGVTMELRQQKQLALWVGGQATGRRNRRRICPAQCHTTGTNKQKVVSVTNEPVHTNTNSCRTARSWHKQTAATDKTTQSWNRKKAAQPLRQNTIWEKKTSHIACEEKPHRIVAAGVPWQQSKNGKVTVN